MRSRAACPRSTPIVPRASSNRRRRRGVGVRGPGAAERRVQRRRRPAVERVQLRADALRRDAARRVGHRRAHLRHGHRTACTRRSASRRSSRGSPASGSSSSPTIPTSRSASVRAWNDWMLEDWVGYAPGRIIPIQIPYLRDPEVAAAEMRRNAERGFNAMTFSEAPDKLGLPSMHSGHWDPLIAACEETGTVVCLHVGSSGTSPTTSPDAPSDTIGVLFFGYAMYAAVDWLYSRIPVRFPDIKHLPVRGRHRVGRRSPRPARPRAQVRLDVRHVERRRAEPGRHLPSQLLGVRDRRPVARSCNAT